MSALNGFLNILKPPGMTSSDAVVFVRRKLPKGTKIGHGGTLDLEAAGVLPICIGKATRLFDYIIDKEKEYIAELRLGQTTDTQDATGVLVAERPVTVGAKDIERLLPIFTGEIEQIPPMFSAIKRDGRRLYEAARAGDVVEVSSRRVHVRSMEYMGSSGEDRHMLRVCCGKGVYIRTLMHDLGALLGCGGHMSFLLRSRAGIFCAQEGVTLDEIDESFDWRTKLYAPDAPLVHLPAIEVDACHRRALQNGNAVRREWYEKQVPVDTLIRIYCDGEFAGIAYADEEGILRFRQCFFGGEANE